MVLGIETATSVCAAALVRDGTVLAEYSVDAQYVHSERLIGLIEECYRSINGAPPVPGAIAVSIGPGSFTGLRIGLSVAKGLAYAASRPLVAVSTLEAMAHRSVLLGHAAAGDFLMPMIDARRDEVYTAIYRYLDGSLRPVLGPSASVIRDIPGACSGAAGAAGVVVTGDGAAKLQAFLRSRDHADAGLFRFVDAASRQCSASSVALLGERNALTGDVADTASIEPYYVKEFQTLVKTQHPEVIR